MFIPVYIFFELIISIFVLGIALGVFVLFYTKTVTKLKKLEHLLFREKKKEHRHAEDYLDEAKEKAYHIVQDATEKAEKTLGEADVFNQDIKEDLQKELQVVSEKESQELTTMSAELMALYQSTMAQVKEDTVKLFQDISKNIERESVQELSDFKEILEKETIASQKIIGERLDAEYETVRKEILSYKSQELRKVDESIYTLIKQVSEMVLGKALSLEDQQKLILDSLEKVKGDLQH